MIKVGITGGIGSGKSLICEVFSVLNVPVYHADAEAHALTDHDADIRAELTALFGKEIYQDKMLNRPLLADQIFNNRDILEKVNRIIHPRVAAHFAQWCAMYPDDPYIVQESAILFESRAYLSFYKTVVVTAPESIRIGRVLSRKNMTPDKIRAILQNQLPEEEIAGRSDFIINNDGQELVIPQVLHLHKTFLSLSKNYNEKIR
jgi:dephospho-CoA kinase